MDIERFTKKIFGEKEIIPSHRFLLEASVITEKHSPEKNLENLELLGDKLLGLAFVEYLFTNPKYCRLATIPKASAMVSRKIIDCLQSKWEAYLCKKIRLDEQIKFSAVEPKSFDQICEDVFESWIGVCKLVYGYEPVFKFLTKLFDLLDVDFSTYERLFDAKTRLNDIVSKVGCRKVLYETFFVEEQMVFECKSSVTGRFHLSGFGSSPDKAAAEAGAAENLIEEFRNHLNVDRVMIELPTFKLWKRFYEKFSETDRAQKRTRDHIDDSVSKVQKK